MRYLMLFALLGCGSSTPAPEDASSDADAAEVAMDTGSEDAAMDATEEAPDADLDAEAPPDVVTDDSSTEDAAGEPDGGDAG
jgi:hypothetical protein